MCNIHPFIVAANQDNSKGEFTIILLSEQCISHHGPTDYPSHILHGNQMPGVRTNGQPLAPDIVTSQNLKENCHVLDQRSKTSNTPHTLPGLTAKSTVHFLTSAMSQYRGFKGQLCTELKRSKLFGTA